MASRRRWLLLLVCAVALGQAAAGYGAYRFLAAGTDVPPVFRALPAMDAAIAAIVTAAAPDAAVTIAGILPASGCDLSTLRRGARYDRAANLYTDPGAEAALVERIGRSLAASYPTRHDPGTASLSATVGGGVTVTVGQLGPGWLAATAHTDCRPPGGPLPEFRTAVPEPARARVLALLATLGAAPVEATWHTRRLACARGEAYTVGVASAATDTGSITDRLQDTLPAAARLFHSGANRQAYRDGPVSVLVASSDDGTRLGVQYTVDCPG